MGTYPSKDGTDEGGSLHDAAIPVRTDQSRSGVPHHMGDAAGAPVEPKFVPPSSASDVAMVGAETDMDDVVPTVFRWEHGGRNVYITGTFNNWERQIPMHRSGNDFSYVHNLKRGKHAYKFIVDDEWRHSPDQQTIDDLEGRTNNFIDVSDFAPYMGDDKFFERSKGNLITLFFSSLSLYIYIYIYICIFLCQIY